MKIITIGLKAIGMAEQAAIRGCVAKVTSS